MLYPLKEIYEGKAVDYFLINDKEWAFNFVALKVGDDKNDFIPLN